MTHDEHIKIGGLKAGQIVNCSYDLWIRGDCNHHHHAVTVISIERDNYSGSSTKPSLYNCLTPDGTIRTYSYEWLFLLRKDL